VLNLNAPEADFCRDPDRRETEVDRTTVTYLQGCAPRLSSVAISGERLKVESVFGDPDGLFIELTVTTLPVSKLAQNVASGKAFL
jgi:hypothetical protein